MARFDVTATFPAVVAESETEAAAKVYEALHEAAEAGYLAGLCFELLETCATDVTDTTAAEYQEGVA